MNKITIQDYSVTIVITDDKKFLLIDKREQTRVANTVEELLKIIKEMFEDAQREGK